MTDQIPPLAADEVEMITPDGKRVETYKKDDPRLGNLAPGYKPLNPSAIPAKPDDDTIDLITPDLKSVETYKRDDPRLGNLAPGYKQYTPEREEFSKKVRSNLDLIDAGKKPDIDASFFTKDRKLSLLELQKDGTYKAVLKDPADAAKGLGEGNLNFKDDDTQAAYEAYKIKSEKVPIIDPQSAADRATGQGLFGDLVDLAESAGKIGSFMAIGGTNPDVGKGFDKIKKNVSDPTVNYFGLKEQNDPHLVLSRIARESQSYEHPGYKALGKIAANVGVAEFGGEFAGIGRAAEGASAAVRGAEFLPPLARGIVAPLARGAIEISPYAALDAARGDHKGAAETLGIGAVLGPAFHIAGEGLSALSEGLSELRQGFAASTSIEARAAQTAAQVDQGLIRFGMKEAEVAGMKIEDKLAALKSIEAAGGEKAIRSIAEGSELVSPIRRLDAEIAASEVIPRLTGITQDIVNTSERKAAEALLASNIKTIEKLADKSGNIPLSDLLEYTQSTAKKLRSGDALLDTVNQRIYDTTSKQLLEEASAAAATKDVKALQEFTSAYNTTKIASAFDTKLAADALKPASELTTTGKIGKFLKNLAEHKLETAASIIGGKLIPGVGHIGGYYAGKGATKLINSYIANAAENGTKLGSFLKKVSSSSDAASFLGLDAIHAMAAQVQKIEPFMKDLSIKSAPTFSKIINPIAHMLGNDTAGLSKAQQFDKFANQVAKLQNPDVRQAHIQEAVAPFSAHPEFASGLAEQMNKQIQFIHDIMPKDPSPPKPFQRNTKWQPSKADMDQFNAQLKIAANPYALLDNLKTGTITPKQVAVAAALNPDILNRIRTELGNIAASGKVNLNYRQRLNASMLMGTAMDQSLNNIPQLQSMYGTAPPQNSPPVKAATKGGSKIRADRLPAAQPTMSQRLSNPNQMRLK